MSPSADTAASQWLEQLATMRAAIAELKLPKTNGDLKDLSYGNDYDLDEDDLSPASGSDDIWDIISDEDEDESKDTNRTNVLCLQFQQISKIMDNASRR